MRSADPSLQARRLSLWAGLLWALLPGWAAAQAGTAPKATVPPSACERLVQVAQALALAGTGTTGRYHCETQQHTRTGQALALRYRGPEVADGSSNLVGYYEVDRGTQSVHAWDLATGKRAAGALADGALPPPTVMACGLAFELPVHYRTTRPQRSESEGRTVCAFDVVAAKSKPVQLDCKGRREGGSPPYNVCDWAIGSDADKTTVRVAHTRLNRDRWGIDPFVYDNGAWRLPNAYADAAPAERIDFFGRPAYQGGGGLAPGVVPHPHQDLRCHLRGSGRRQGRVGATHPRGGGGTGESARRRSLRGRGGVPDLLWQPARCRTPRCRALMHKWLLPSVPTVS